MEPCALGDRRGKTGVCYPAGAAAMATRPPPKPTIGSSRSFLGFPQSSRPFPTRCTFRCTHSLLCPPPTTELSRLLLCPFYVVVPLAPTTSLSIRLSLFYPPPLVRCFSLSLSLWSREQSWPRASSDRCRRKSRRSSWPPGESLPSRMIFRVFLYVERYARARVHGRFTARFL